MKSVVKNQLSQILCITIALSFVCPPSFSAVPTTSIETLVPKSLQSGLGIQENLENDSQRVLIAQNGVTTEPSEENFDYQSVDQSPGKCKEWDFVTIHPASNVEVNLKLAPCGNNGLVVILDSKGDVSQYDQADAFLKSRGIPSQFRIPLRSTSGVFVSPHYTFVAMGASGLAVVRNQDFLLGRNLPITHLSFPEVSEIHGVAVMTDINKDEIFAYIAHTDGITTVPFPQIRAAIEKQDSQLRFQFLPNISSVLLRNKKLLEEAKEGEGVNWVQVKKFPVLPVSEPHGIEILNETPANFQGGDNFNFQKLIVTTGWGQLRTYSLHDPSRPTPFKNGNIWTPFSIKRDRLGELDYVDYNGTLSGITLLDSVKGDLLVTDKSGRVEAMNLKEYELITSRTREEIMNYVIQNAGGNAAFWSGFVLSAPDFMDGYITAFSGIAEGLMDQWGNPRLKDLGLEPVDASGLRTFNKKGGHLHEPTATTLKDKSAKWVKFLETNKALEPYQAQQMLKVIEEGRGNGRILFAAMLLQMSQIVIAAQVSPVIEMMGKAPKLTQPWKLTKWAFRWFGNKGARTLNSIYSRVGVNMLTRPIQASHFWRAQLWAWIDAVLITVNMYIIRKDSRPEQRLWGTTQAHWFYMHEQWWFDLVLNLVLYSLLMPPALADKGKRGAAISFAGSGIGMLGKYVGLNARRMLGRFKGVMEVNFLMRAWSDFLVQILVKQGVKGIPLSSNRFGFDMGYSPSWVIPSQNIAWLSEDMLLAVAKSFKTSGKLVGFGAEVFAAVLHGYISGIPIEYAIREYYDQPEVIHEKLDRIWTFPTLITPAQAEVKP